MKTILRQSKSPNADSYQHRMTCLPLKNGKNPPFNEKQAQRKYFTFSKRILEARNVEQNFLYLNLPFMNRISLLFVFLLGINLSFAQVVGGRENSEMIPQAAKATELSGGGFVGDVNIMTGEFQASVPLGSVSTPAGLGFSLSLNHSSSFAYSQNQPMTAGIPYGDGWSPNIPTVSIETDVFRKFNCNQLQQEGGIAPSVSDLRYDQGEHTGVDEGDLYWFSPMVNISGVVSGRAIFKYIDNDDDKCLVFVLNQFESPVELRYYGNKWTVQIADGTKYEFSTHLANYRAPSNQRILFYDQSSINTPTEVNINRDLALNDTYSTHAQAVQNVVEPKQTYSVWHCDLIYNQNTPLQGVRFTYEKFGKFNYFEEFNQQRYQGVRTDVFNTSTNTDFSAYSDIFLQKVYSYVMETPFEIVELDYETAHNLVDNNTMLDFDQSYVERKDSLYNYTTVYDWGNTENFLGWHRAKHWAATPAFNGEVNPVNPYLSTNGTNAYFREQNTDPNEMPFDHGFLESPRIFDGANIYPGDIYEIRTTISRPDGSDYDNGNGTLDIAVRTGTLNNTPNLETNSFIATSGNQTASEFDHQKGVEVFSTFNSAVKWQMGFGQSVLNTSNFFVMPNIPITYHGMNIQIGGGNSDIDYNADLSLDYDIYNAQTDKLNLMHAYPFYVNADRKVKAAATISHNFGTGHPWGMMIPVYNELALSDPSLSNPQPNSEELYGTWWLDPQQDALLTNHQNTPTKFDQDVVLENMQLIRYSKNPYMLQGVKTYKVNGDYAQLPNGEYSGTQLVSQKRLEYEAKDETLIRNYDYNNGEPIHNESYLRRVILLSQVREIPVDIALTPYNTSYNLATPADTSKLLTTFFGYTKILDNANSSYTYDDSKPYQGLNQYLLDTYVDHLGGITKVEYYPFGGNGETRSSSTYIFQPCDANMPPRQAMSKGEAYTGHAAVKFLGKNDEQDVLLSNTNPFDPNLIHKVWEYQYDVNSKIYNPKQMEVPDAYFKAQHLRRKDVSFGKVRVISPKLSTGEYTYTDYEYYGNPDWDDQPTLEEFLYFGKLKSLKVYDQNDVPHRETITEYDHTLAFKNAFSRPNPVREKLGYDDLFARSYEYEDIYKNEPLTIEIDSIIYTGQAAYKYIDAPYLNGNYSDREQSKFLEFPFFNELLALNPVYFFDSYFVKKTAEINREYENTLEKLGGTSNPVPPLVAPKQPNPFGGGYVNPITDDPVTTSALIQDINTLNSNNAALALINASPLSDTVLTYLIGSNVKQKKIASVLATQGGLSNNVWKAVLDNQNKFSGASLNLLVDVQPYFSDEIQTHLIQTMTVSTNYRFARKLLLKNEYLSNNVVLEMTNPSNEFPEEVFGRVIQAQPALPSLTLTEVINCVHLKDLNLVKSLSSQILSSEHWQQILYRADFSTREITRLVESTDAYPSDVALDLILGYSPQFKNRQIVRIFDGLNRPLSSSLEAKLLTNYPQVANDIIYRPFTGNPLDQYCYNVVAQNRKYIETKTEYDYYEADYTGKAVGVAYEMLLGHRTEIDDPSPYPFVVVAAHYNNQFASSPNGGRQIVRNLRLKHEPSWQIYSMKTSSPQHPDAYNREEFYYLYDLQNRYDRYWYNYDLASGNYHLQTYDLFPNTFSEDTTAVNLNWASEYSDLTYPKLPPFDGMERSRTYGNRVFAFQKSVLSKNARDEKPLIRSEYYDYDRRWTFNDLPEGIETVTYDSVPCPTAPPQDSLPCDNFFDCTDCYEFKYTTDEQMQSLVPLGYCAYSSPTLGWFICPHAANVSSYAPDATTQYCNLGVSSSNSPIVNPVVVAVPKALPFGDALSKTLLLRSVTLQVDTLDHSTSQEFAGVKMDRKNARVAEFTLGNFADTDANNFAAPYSMIYPYDNLTVRTILERNRYLQPALEEDEIGLQTKYYYNSSQSYWNTNANCTNPAYAYLFNYQSTLNKDIGEPVRITVGYNKVDSLATSYDYNEIGLVEKTTSPTGKYLDYTFDNYYRLLSVTENGNRHLTDNEYFNWNHEFNSLFEQRTEDNYVQTTLYNSDPANDPNGLNKETCKAFLDPLGRNHSVVTAYSTDALNHVEIHSGTVLYDNWGRVTRSYKSYRRDSTTTTVGAPKIHLDNETGNPFGETIFENDPKARPLRTSNYDVSVTGVHAVKTTYNLVNDIYASCELDLGAKEMQLVFGDAPSNQYCFIRTEVLDQDNKRSVEYLNAIGQKVAALKYNGDQKIVTLFVYDSYGNVELVINPEKQQSLYEYNILGQLVKEKTVDAGTKRYMYNKQGLVSVSLDEQGQFYNPNGNGMPGDPTTGTTDAFYRVFKYDDFGRLLKVARSAAPDYSLNQEITPLHYKTVVVGDTANGIPENGDFSPQGRYIDYQYTNASSQDWLASFKAWGTNPVGGMQTGQIITVNGLDNSLINFLPTELEKEFQYGGNVNSNEIGQLVKSYSYDNEGLKIQRIDYTYDDNDNLKHQTIAFNPDTDVDQNNNNLVSTIDYPAYNFRNSLIEQRVDVNADNVVDYHCYMQYDPLNRLKAIYGAAGLADSISDATLLVSYTYDDANGLIDKKTHHIDNQALSVLAKQIDYTFDTRDRLTRVTAGLQDTIMDYQLFYDDNVPMYSEGTNVEVVNYSSNWNGNINGTTMRYGLQGINLVNPVSDYDKPLLYGYTYDKINRLIDADATVGNLLQSGALEAESRSIGDVSISYDRIGNIQSLHRTMRGSDPSASAPYSEIQHWNYKYFAETNRLATVDGQSGTLSRAYLYDANGNVLTDNYKNITSTEYGRAAYPFHLTKAQTEIDYLYSASDLRIYKKLETPNGQLTEVIEDYYLIDGFGKTVAIFHKSSTWSAWEYYASSTERECRLIPTDAQAPIANVNNTTGVRFGKDQVSFYLYDHLGNTRLTYTPVGFTSHTGITVSLDSINTVVDYFPYGKVLRGYNSYEERYLTTQHERDHITNLDYRGARYYDGDVGRFLSTDPWQDKYPAWSTYNYVMGNPIIFIDPTGKGPTWIDNGDGTYTAEEGDGAWTLYTQHLKEKGYTWDETKDIFELDGYSNYEQDGIVRTRINPGSIVDVDGFDYEKVLAVLIDQENEILEEIAETKSKIEEARNKAQKYWEIVWEHNRNEDLRKQTKQNKPQPGDPGDGNHWGEVFRNKEPDSVGEAHWLSDQWSIIREREKQNLDSLRNERGNIKQIQRAVIKRIQEKQQNRSN